MLQESAKRWLLPWNRMIDEKVWSIINSTWTLFDFCYKIIKNNFLYSLCYAITSFRFFTIWTKKINISTSELNKLIKYNRSWTSGVVSWLTVWLLLRLTFKRLAINLCFIGLVSHRLPVVIGVFLPSICWLSAASTPQQLLTILACYILIRETTTKQSNTTSKLSRLQKI